MRVSDLACAWLTPSKLVLVPKLSLNATILNHYVASRSGMENRMKIEIVHCPT
jgi:hypothetical protein